MWFLFRLECFGNWKFRLKGNLESFLLGSSLQRKDQLHFKHSHWLPLKNSFPSSYVSKEPCKIINVGSDQRLEPPRRCASAWPKVGFGISTNTKNVYYRKPRTIFMNNHGIEVLKRLNSLFYPISVTSSPWMPYLKLLHQTNKLPLLPCITTENQAFYKHPNEFENSDGKQLNTREVGRFNLKQKL